jgi:hypothetical protein
VAEVGTRNLKKNPLIARAESDVRIATGSIVGTVLCAPANPISTSPIMPEVWGLRRMFKRFCAAVATSREDHRSPSFHPGLEESWLQPLLLVGVL